MDATIKLYTRAIGLEAEKLQMVEDIADYLDSKEASPFTAKIQYQKIELNKYVKILLNQSYESPLKSANYVYCSIVNGDNTRPLYYWIKKLNWKSQSAIELELVLDTLNTFVLGTDYTFSPKTIIQRQHKDRMTYYTGESLTYTQASLQPEAFSTTKYFSLSVTNPRYLEFDFDGQIIVGVSFNTNATARKYNTSTNKFTSELTDEFDYIADGGDGVFEFQLNGVTIDSFSLDTNEVLVIKMTSPTIWNDQDQTTYFWETYLNGYVEVEDTSSFIRKINLISEELNPQLYGDENTNTIIEDEKSNIDWYLVYNTNSSDVVEAFILPSETTSVAIQGTFATKEIHPAMIPNSTFPYGILISLSTYDKDDFLRANGGTLPTYTGLSGYGEEKYLLLRSQGGVILGNILTYDTQTLGGTEISGYFASPSFATPYVKYEGNSASIVYGKALSDYGNDIFTQNAIASSEATGYSFTGSETIITLKGIDNLNRTLSTLIKVIKLPYLPYGFTTSNGLLSVSTNDFSLDLNLLSLNYALKLNDLELKLNNTLTNNSIKSPIDEDMKMSDIVLTLDEDRNDYNESKLYHSEFYQNQFFYDSFGFVYKLELIDMNKYISNYQLATKYIDITYHMTTTIASKMAFEFNDYLTGDKKEQNIDNWLLIGRNNEEVIYNSSYINYLRVGYNYDVKNKETQNARNWISAGASILGTVISVVGAVASHGATLPLAIMSVSGAIASATTITNAVASQAQNERSIAEKLDTLKLQSASVSGSDDVDLMSRYCDNRLHLIKYKPEDRVTNLLKDLFYFYGYKDNVTGVPNLSTRIWFNHLKCEPILDFASINMTQEIEEELKGIMRNGFTIFHHYNSTWDIDQEKENWEVSMLSYLS